MKVQISELKRQIDLLSNSADIPYNVEHAFRTRFKLDTYNPIIVSTKGATTENKAVNEAGSSSYGVLNSPDGFLEITLGGSIKYIPMYT